MKGLAGDTPDEPTVGSLWQSKRGKETLRIERVWIYSWPHAHDGGPQLTVRGHPVHGGRPLVCPVADLRERYRPAGTVLAPYDVKFVAR